MREETAEPATRSSEPIRDVTRGAEKRASDVGERLRLLCGGTPREILERLLDGDPLRLRALVAERLRAGRMLLDADRVFLCTLARCAREARRYTGRPRLRAWLIGCVDAAIDEVQRRDLARLRAGGEGKGTGEAGGAHAELAVPLGLDPHEMLAACTRFNALGREGRDAFFALFVEGRSIDELARAAGASASSVARQARLAIDVLLEAGSRT